MFTSATVKSAGNTKYPARKLSMTGANLYQVKANATTVDIKGAQHNVGRPSVCGPHFNYPFAGKPRSNERVCTHTLAMPCRTSPLQTFSNSSYKYRTCTLLEL